MRWMALMMGQDPCQQLCWPDIHPGNNRLDLVQSTQKAARKILELVAALLCLGTSLEPIQQ
jgi:hypothetical protein